MTTPSPLALIPAAGFARRLGVDGTKAALPLDARRPLAAGLVESLRRSGVSDALVIRRAGGWDLAAALGDGGERGVRISYLVVEPTPSLPHTIARAAVQARGRRIALGFPDVLFEPVDAFAPMLERQAATGAAVVLGLFPTERPSRSDMVVLDARGRPIDLVLTPATTTLDYAWLLAVWTPEVTAFLEHYVRSEAAAAIASSRELRLGDVLRAALAAGLPTEAVTFPGGGFLDVATPEDLVAARARAARARGTTA
jgi:glucose-1-phosphate thymidylyltransferase